MTILMVASEMTPFCKTGGLADVIGALPPVIVAAGHQVMVVLPGYAVIDRERYQFAPHPKPFAVPVGDRDEILRVATAEWRGVTVCLIECESYKRPGLYGDADGDYPDNAERFIVLARGALAAARLLGFRPQVVHAHDWQAGLVPAYLATLYRQDSWFADTTTLFTIHNLGYQGVFPIETFNLTGLPASELSWRRMEYWGQVSFLKEGIIRADAVSTVSPRYAAEITRPSLGFGMEGILSERQAVLHGFLNGIDQEEWNPATDTGIPARYSAADAAGKKRCRKSLLDGCKIAAGSDTLVVGMVARLDSQKGFDILADSLERLMALDIRLIVLGAGNPEYADILTRAAAAHPDRLVAVIGFDSTFAHQIYAGADAFLMPSRYEPCGLGQLIALRYGTLPIVHETGGLADTVQDLTCLPGGNGFTFAAYTDDALVEAVTRARALHGEPGRDRWRRAVRRAMEEDYSWSRSAEQYLDLYRRITRQPVS